MDWSQNQTKLFRALLYCYPAEFRHEYGDEMQHIFASRLAHEPHWRLWLDTLADLTLAAPKEHVAILASDLKHELRALRAIPGFTAIVLLVTALGIGATVAVFSVVNAVLLRSMPYAHPETLVYLFTPNVNFTGLQSEIAPNVPDVYDWQRLSHTISSFAMFMPGSTRLFDRSNVTNLGSVRVSTDFFQTLGVKPVLGRTFAWSDEQPGHDLVAVISHRLWLSHFDARLDILGTQIQLDRKTFAIIGVMPPEFGFPFESDVPYLSTGISQSDVWLPLAYTPQQMTNRNHDDIQGAIVIGRLKPGATSISAQTELNAIESRLNSLYSPDFRGWQVLARPLLQTIFGPIQRMLWTLLCAVALVLLIAIANVAGLLLARTTSRAHELGIRIALGAQRARIIRQLLTESLLLSISGGALGIALAYALVRLLINLNPGGVSRFQFASINPVVLSVAVALSIATGLAAGILPALSASSSRVHAGNRITASQRGRSALISTEIALSVVLLSGAGLLIRSYLNLQAVDPGFSPSIVTFNVSLDDHYPTQQSQDIFYKTLLDKLRTAPGFELVGASTEIPLTHDLGFADCEVEGYGKTPELVQVFVATPDYRKVIGTPLLRGRDFTAADLKTNNVLINKQLARTYFRSRDPIGARLRLGPATNPWLTVIGVLADVRDLSIAEQAKPTLVQPAEFGNGFAVRSNLPIEQTNSQIRALIRSLDPTLTSQIKTMRERITESNAQRTFQTTLLTGFALVAVTLALVGLYGLMSYAVKQRAPEIAIRLAIGSPRTRVLALILSQGMRLTAYGIIIGLAASFAVTRLINTWLFETQPTDPLTFTLVPLSILAIAFAACFVPAWSATSIDPMRTLRQD